MIGLIPSSLMSIEILINNVEKDENLDKSVWYINIIFERKQKDYFLASRFKNQRCSDLHQKLDSCENNLRTWIPTTKMKMQKNEVICLIISHDWTEFKPEVRSDEM